MDYTKEILLKIPETDAIVINGDLLGIFSMTQSCLHKGKRITDEELDMYLKAAAPMFHEKFKQKNEVTPDMVLEYVVERYQGCLKIFKQFSLLKKTFFNMGNHESSLHFLVLQEIPFLTQCNPGVLGQVDQELLMQIFEAFESKLHDLEETYDFHYIRHGHFIDGETMVIGIPGESHSTVGGDYESNMQEKKTQEIVEAAKRDLDKVSKLIIYNHTQGNYDGAVGKFDTASPTLKQFMTNLPENIQVKIYVQSHNHWDNTQFMFHSGFNYILNNAGLHNGLFNFLDFSSEDVRCYDLDPVNKKVIKLKLATEFTQVRSQKDIVARNYPNPEEVMIRKNVNRLLGLIVGEN